MATTYNDAQSLWPLSGASNNCSERAFGTPIMPNTTNSRICGIQSSNRAVAERCCGTNEVHQYQCWLYCEHIGSMKSWNQCTYDNTTAGSLGPFCQEGLVSNSTDSLTSSALRSSAPKYSWIVFVLVSAFLFIGPGQATTGPSFAKELVKRQSDSRCTLNIDRNYTSLQHGTVKVTADFAGPCREQAGCSWGFGNLELSNNRTLNGSAAVEPKFDAFFDAVSESTSGRRFPAVGLSYVSREIVFSGNTFFLGWTPISFCVNGTATGCSDDLEAATDGSYFQACGPAFVDNKDEGSPIQGILAPVSR